MKHRQRVRLFVLARIVVTLLFLASVIVLKLQDPEAIDNFAFRGIVQLMALSCLFSAASLAVLRMQRWLQPLTYAQIVWDLLFVTCLLIFTDGIASPYSFLYLLAIMNAAMLLSRREAIYTAAVCGILYGAMVDLQYYGLLVSLGLSPLAALQRGEGVVFYTIFLHLTGFVLTASITGYLAERARSSEDALRATEINYDELNRLHGTIVHNLEYGLITITGQGTIRVFNPFVEQLSGVSQAQAYDRHISSIFPHLAVQGREGEKRHGEFTYRSSTGTPLVIGYSAIPFFDTMGDSAGLIVSLRNLTELRQMELALKRADRLAALGELSARMAHEIRNPLAAISGSVQLLAGNSALCEQEARLLSIVLRESDRLNLLISEFLSYARPAEPRFVRFELNGFLQDLLLLLKADSRFEQIRITTALTTGVVVNADQGQLHQVLLNLLQNAAEAMPSGGELELETAVQSGADDAGQAFSLVRIAVSDRGTGIDDETRKHLFEPFWTTKPAGTGLGLATVYRIVEAHGGAIQAHDREGGGTVFTILLPIVEELA